MSKPAAPVNHDALKPYTPYITRWSEEPEPEALLIERPGRGIGYLDEALCDRDRRGVLWQRAVSRPGVGEPLFSQVHPLRQRRAMQRLLCNVCGKPADQSDDGVLWLVRDFRDDWPGWPENMGVTEPPVCLPCARVASRLCPALRKGAVALRAGRAPIAGVCGLLYRGGGELGPVPMEKINVAYEDPLVRWVLAGHLLRELHDCTILEVDELCRNSTAA